jgi:hypothetical protein
MCKLIVHARKAGAQGLPTERFEFSGTDRDAAWSEWEKFNRSTNFKWEWMPLSSRYTRRVA